MSRADVCFVLEGTYPFVAGGVSSWVHTLIEDLPDLTFEVLHISPSPGFNARGPLYPAPKNLLGVREVFLQPGPSPTGGRQPDPEALRRFVRLLGELRSGRPERLPEFVEASEALAGCSPADLVRGPAAWSILVETYRAEAAAESFMSFFWTWAFVHMPFLQVMRAELPDASVYHTSCTGYAGLLAAVAKVRTGRPMLLTEHGIYTKERRIEFNQADWIHDWKPEGLLPRKTTPYFETFWGRHFEMMSRLAYEQADLILTLYDGNRRTQEREGADGDKIEVVPNGMEPARFAEAAARLTARGENERFTIGFIGRVTPVKDVFTLLRAMRLVADEAPEIRVEILGPMEEDQDYARECVAMTARLGLEDVVTFRGRVKVMDALPTLDVVVLTSISEAQPLVVLEAGAVGLPVVSTAVGSCAELLLGRTAEDRALGAGGILTPIATPGATAEAVLRLQRDPELRRRFGRTLQERVRRYYGLGDTLAAYGAIYERFRKAA